MARILITGGTGLIGQRLQKHIRENNHEPFVISRNCGKRENCIEWDLEHKALNPEQVAGMDYVVHLAGSGMAEKRWDKNEKGKILNSRLRSTKVLFDTIEQVENRPKAIVAASAINYYGVVTRNQVFTEESPKGDGFLPDVIDLWEQETSRFRELGIKTTQLRIGVVLAENGGALEEMTRFPLIGAVGSGRQCLPWIHIDDLCRLILWSLENRDTNTVYNAVASEHINNKEFTKLLAKHSGKWMVPFNAPAFALKLAFGEMAGVVLEGTPASNEKLRNAGFEFRYESADEALKNLF